MGGAWRRPHTYVKPIRKPKHTAAREAALRMCPELRQGGSWTAPVVPEPVVEPETYFANSVPVEPTPPVIYVPFHWKALYDAPTEVVEPILANLSLVDINNLLASVDKKLATRLSKFVYEVNGKKEYQGQIIAVISEDDDLYECGQLRSIRDELNCDLKQISTRDCFKALQSLIISGSTNLVAKDLEFLRMPVGTKDEEYGQLRSIEIYNSNTFSPFALLHHAALWEKSYGPIAFKLTGTHEMLTWSGFKFRNNAKAFVLTFCYMYGADLWRNFQSIFHGELLGSVTCGAAEIVKKSRAIKDEPTSWGATDAWQYGTAQDEAFLQNVALDAWNGGNLINQDHVQMVFPCETCHYRIPRFGYSDAQFKLVRAGEGGECLMCRYDQWEHEDLTMMPLREKFKENASQYRDEWVGKNKFEAKLFFYPFPPETLGCRSTNLPLSERKSYAKEDLTESSGVQGEVSSKSQPSITTGEVSSASKTSITTGDEFNAVELPDRKKNDSTTIGPVSTTSKEGNKATEQSSRGQEKLDKIEMAAIEEANLLNHKQTAADFEKYLSAFKNLDARFYPTSVEKCIKWDGISMDCHVSEIDFEDCELPLEQADEYGNLEQQQAMKTSSLGEVYQEGGRY